jgi:hypothetical protein
MDDRFVSDDLTILNDTQTFVTSERAEVPTSADPKVFRAVSLSQLLDCLVDEFDEPNTYIRGKRPPFAEVADSMITASGLERYRLHISGRYALGFHVSHPQMPICVITSSIA